METLETIINKLIENRSYEMVGIEYHDHIILWQFRKLEKNIGLLFIGM